MMAILPLSLTFSRADCKKRSCASLLAGSPAKKRDLLSWASFTASSTPSFAFSPPHEVPNGGFSIMKSNFSFGNSLFFRVSVFKIFFSFCPFMSISALQIA